MLLFCPIFFSSTFAQPPNDDCNNAIQLTNGNQLCGQNSQNATPENCYADFAGSNESDMWYYFQATNDTMVLQFLQTNTTNLYPVIMVYGPFNTPTGGCGTPGVTAIPCNCGSPAYDFDITPNTDYQGTEGNCYLISNGDPGNYMPLYGLTVGQYYLVRIQNNNGGGPGSRWVQFCIGIDEPATNALPQGSATIDQCGTTFSGTTSGGYTGAFFCTASGGYLFGDPDCDGTGEISFVVNNPSWYSFCPATSGTWQVTYTITNCTFSGANAGGQIAILKDPDGGAPTNLDPVQQSSSSCGAIGNAQVPPGCSWTSNTFTVNAGECAYLLVDGFAGDACDYTVELTNVSGGCILLDLMVFHFQITCQDNTRIIGWEGTSDENSQYILRFFDPEKNKEQTIAQIPATSLHYTIPDPQHSNLPGIYYLYAHTPEGGEELLTSLYVSSCFKTVQPAVSIENNYLVISGLNEQCKTGSVNIYSYTGQHIHSIPFSCNSESIAIPLDYTLKDILSAPGTLIVLQNEKGSVLTIRKTPFQVE